MRFIAETACSKKCKRSVAAILSNFQSCWNIVVLGVKLKVLRQGNHCDNYFWNIQKVLGEWGYIFKLVANFSNCIPDIVKNRCKLGNMLGSRDIWYKHLESSHFTNCVCYITILHYISSIQGFLP